MFLVAVAGSTCQNFYNFLLWSLFNQNFPKHFDLLQSCGGEGVYWSDDCNPSMATKLSDCQVQGCTKNWTRQNLLIGWKACVDHQIHPIAFPANVETDDDKDIHKESPLQVGAVTIVSNFTTDYLCKVVKYCCGSNFIEIFTINCVICNDKQIVNDNFFMDNETVCDSFMKDANAVHWMAEIAF